jgi:hypothetical protein
VRKITRTTICDRCGELAEPPGYWELRINLVGCVSSRADLCKACMCEFEAWLGKTTQQLHDQNRVEEDEGE